MRVFMIFFLSFASSLASMNLDPSKRLVAKIGKDSINRISIENDRIAQVFGDAETFELQTEEGTGQIFLKPTQENGTKPLSITLITENGITQDLKLIPSFDTASSLVLKGSVSQKASIARNDTRLTSMENTIRSPLELKMPYNEEKILFNALIC